MKQFLGKDGVRYRGASIGVFDPGSNAKIIFGEQYDETFYATSCAYLLRRFGPAHRGCDPYKDLTKYVLTTNDDRALLTVSPCCSVSTSFGYLLNNELYEKTMEADFVSRRSKSYIEAKDCEIRSPVIQALCEAMEELKKPVNVRDWFFNIVGRVRDDNFGTAEYSKFAGYGIIEEYFDRFKKEQP